MKSWRESGNWAWLNITIWVLVFCCVVSLLLFQLRVDKGDWRVMVQDEGFIPISEPADAARLDRAMAKVKRTPAGADEKAAHSLHSIWLVYYLEDQVSGREYCICLVDGVVTEVGKPGRYLLADGEALAELKDVIEPYIH